MPYRYPPEFRRRVLDLFAVGRSVAFLSADLGVSDQTIYNWRRQDRIDRGGEPGTTSAEQAELIATRRWIVELETIYVGRTVRQSSSRASPLHNRPGSRFSGAPSLRGVPNGFKRPYEPTTQAERPYTY